MAKLRVERMKQGLLVIGTDQIAEARKFAGDALPVRWDSSHPGRWRKVPGQWSDWELYAVSDTANPRGSFLGVVFYFAAGYSE